VDGIEPKRAAGAWPAWGVGALTAVFAAEILALAWMLAPFERFARFAFADSGADLVIRDLVARGYRPTVDFGYVYGLLPLLANRIWYALMGPTPAAFRLGVIACDLAMAWGLARFAAAQRVGLAGVALILAAMPYALQASTIALAHVLERALLVHALAEQARGRRGAALGLVTAAAFVKPSMSFVYGLALLLAIGLAARGRGPRRWPRALAPAALTGAVLALVLGAAYGARPLANSLTPGAGIEVYRQGHYGFFHGTGRDFWYRPGVGLAGYLRFEVGTWLAGSGCLVCGACGWLRRGAAWPARNGEIVATCALLHVAFVAVFFGNRWSWAYYYILLVVGLAAIAPRGRLPAAVIGGLAVLLLAADRAKVQEARHLWREESATAAMLGLWATEEERAGWAKVLELTRGRRPALMATVEGAALLYPGFAPPMGAYFVPGHPLPAELHRKAEQLAAASMVVIGPMPLGSYRQWPELTAALAGHRLTWGDRNYRVYERIEPPYGGTRGPISAGR